MEALVRVDAQCGGGLLGGLDLYSHKVGRNYCPVRGEPKLERIHRRGGNYLVSRLLDTLSHELREAEERLDEADPNWRETVWQENQRQDAEFL